MLKLLFITCLFSGSLDSFSQERDSTLFDGAKWTPAISTDKGTPYLIGYLHDFGRPCKCPQCMAKNKPDTLRAICLVTMCRKCAAEPMAGYVVICEGKEVVYLDCRKRALKLPQVGWGYRVVNPNEKVR